MARIAGVFLLSFALPACLAAQEATLRGAVTDVSGGVVVGAVVTMTAQTGAPRSRTSGARGDYEFTGLAPGTYTIRASAPQLTLPQTAVTLADGINTLDLQLQIAAIAETIGVETDGPPAVQTDATANASATVLSGEELDALPDDPEDLLADLQALAGPSAGPGGGSIFVDGFSGGVLPPKETIREIRINQNPFSPEFDKLGLGRIEILTKPGTDQWHGNLNYNFATDAWNSRNPYSAVKAPLLLNEFENTLGGRIAKGLSLSLDVNQNDVDNGAVVNAVTLNPTTLLAAPFSDVFKTIQRRTNLYPRIDYQLNDRNTLSLRYAFTHGSILGAGINGFNLASLGEDRRYTVQTVQGIETAVLGASTINETRFQFYRNAFESTPDSLAPALQVLGAFNAGGTPVGNSRNTERDLEFQNNSTVVHGMQTWRFGIRARQQVIDETSPQNFNGTFTFGSRLAPLLDANNNPLPDSSGQPQLIEIQGLEAYRRTLLFAQLGDSPATIRNLGGGASQFSIATGVPGVSGVQSDASLFAGDDWRVRNNLTLNLGLRYESQTNLPNAGAWAPRVALAWAPAGVSGSAKPPKTIIRAGFGMFYDRFALANTLTAKLYGGALQQQYVLSNPDFFLTVPTLSSLLESSQLTQQTQHVTQEVDAHLRAPYILQTALTMERQILSGTTAAVTWTRSRGVHELRSLDVNAPLAGIYPMGNANPVFLTTSSGVYNQNQLSVNFNSKVNRAVALTGSYTANRARSNTDGLSTFPANPYDYAGEYGPASTDVHNRATLAGTINLRWNIRLSPLVNMQSGAPFDITAGSDLYGTTLFNGRPGFAPIGSTKPGLVQTSYGLLDPNPSPGEALVPRNYGRGPGQMAVNLKAGKTIHFGPEPAGGGNRRFAASLTMSARNILNHTNPGPIVGNITSPLFGQANQMAGSVNGEGFSENANNRRLELQMKVTF